MNISELISAGFIGSVTTLAIKSVIDMLNAHNQYRRELKMQVFKRKTDVVEKAIAWYQEALDTYNMMQITIKGIDTSNQTTWLALQKLIMKCNNLFEESVSRLNPLYLYYDFQEIERKFHATESLSDINDKLVEIQEIGEKYLNLIPKIIRLNTKCYKKKKLLLLMIIQN